jgi:hypothetical protein
MRGSPVAGVRQMLSPLSRLWEAQDRARPELLETQVHGMLSAAIEDAWRETTTVLTNEQEARAWLLASFAANKISLILVLGVLDMQAVDADDSQIRAAIDNRYTIALTKARVVATEASAVRALIRASGGAGYVRRRRFINPAFDVLVPRLKDVPPLADGSDDVVYGLDTPPASAVGEFGLGRTL